MPIRVTAVEPKQIQRLLPGIPAEALSEAAAGARAVTFRAGETIMSDDLRWRPAVIADGLVRLSLKSRDGREATLRMIGRGVTLGLVAMFEPDYRNPLPERMIVAVEGVAVAYLMRRVRVDGIGEAEAGGMNVDPAGRAAAPQKRVG